MVLGSKRTIANALLLIGGGVVVLCFASAVIAVIRVGVGPALNQLTWFHKMGVTVAAVLIGLVCFDFVFNSITKRVFPHLVSESFQINHKAAKILAEMRKEEKLRSEVQTWLCASNGCGLRLLDWIEKDAVVGLPSPEQNLISLVRGLSSNDQGVTSTILLARSLKVILIDGRDELEKRPSPVVAKFFMLCAELACPEVLGEPLLNLAADLKRRGSIPERWTEEVLLSLRSALIANQVDDRLREVWKNLVSGQRDPLLLESRLAGYRGLSQMPPGTNAIGKPDFSAIGFGLKEMSVFWNNADERRVRFRKLVEMVENCYSKHNVNRQLIIEADRQRWEGWAVSCLKLYEEIDTTDDRIRTFMWRPIADCIPERYFQNRAELCSGEVFEVDVLRNHVDFVRRVANEFSPVWRFPYDSEKSVRGFVSDVLEEIIEKMAAKKQSAIAPNFSEEVEAVDSAHQRALRSALHSGNLFDRPAELA